MPSYVIFGLFIATLALPAVVALWAAIYVDKYTRYFVGSVGIMLAIGVHAGTAYYSYLHYPEWWSNYDWPIGFVYVPAAIYNVIGIAWSLKDLADRIDKERSRRVPVYRRR